MRSIRLSLMVCFLALLMAAFGAASYFVYQNTRESLHVKNEKARELLKARYDDRVRRVSDELDASLLAEARTLASLAQFQWQFGRPTIAPHLAPRFGMVAASLAPNGHLLYPAWLMAGNRATPIGDALHRLSISEITFNEDLLFAEGQAPATDHFQINSSWGHVWRSRRLGDESLPLNPAMMASTKPVDWYFDDTILPSGVEARRITLKAWVGRVRFNRNDAKRNEPKKNDGAAQRAEGPRSPNGPRPPNGGRPPNGRPPGQPLPRPAPPPPLVFFFQCAAETAKKDEAIARLQAGLQDDLDQLQAESDETLADLRHRLLLIGLITFGASAVGGLWLVRLNLSPLQRLTEAVRRVSVKDFRLPLDGPPLPHELEPIADRLRETLDELRRAFAREKQAAADISHELRTPLAALLTTIEVSLKKPRSPDEYRETLQDCRESGLQMNQLVERLLKLARLDSGVDPVRPRQVDLAQLAEQCAALVRPLAEARGLALRVHRNGPALLAADPDKLREVVTNLLHNAVEYNRPNGSVDLTVERENGHLCVEVRDTGIGIAPESREHIFERFFRADPSRQAEGLHAGLGLAIVKGYVDLMGGRIDVQSEVGQGSTFRVELPAKS